MNRQEFLSRFQLQLDARGRSQPATHPQAPATWLCSLDHWGVLAISGPDTRKFLQGQLTCDVNAISADKGSYGALCTPKGRMISNFYLLQGEDSDTIVLLMPAACLTKTRETLGKYIVFSKAEMLQESGYTLLGLGGEQAPALGELAAKQRLQAQESSWGMALAVNENRAMLAVKNAELESTWQQLADRATVVAGQHWELCDIADGVGFVYGETQEEFIPQMLNMQLTDGVSFDKGCYTGQEIVARTQYRGKIKRHMRRLSGKADLAPLPGTTLLSADGSNVATVVSAELDAAQLQLLAVVTGNWDSGGIKTEQGISVTEQPLPYALPSEEED